VPSSNRLLRAVQTPQQVNLDREIATTSPVRFSVQRNGLDVAVPTHVTHLHHDPAMQGPG
jgi:hypothetical protein